MNAVASIAAAEPAPTGHNGPPEATPYELMAEHIETLLVEAHAWADGQVVETQAQADEASRLIGDLRTAAADAEKMRVEEKKPLDEQIAEIQARWNVFIANPTTKNPGKVWKAIDALKATVKPFLDKLEAQRQEEARKAREVAEEAARKAREAIQAAQASDLGALEAAGELIADAERAAAQAKHIEGSKTQTRGGARAMGLRKVYRPVMTDRRAALSHYATTNPEAIVACLQKLAEDDVRAGKRTLPGFDVIEETVL